MRKRLARAYKSWVFWAFSCALIFILVITWLVARSPLNQAALENLLRQEMLRDFDVKNLVVKKRIFDLHEMQWNVELSAEITGAWGLPLHLRDFRLEATKKPFHQAIVKKAVFRFGESEKRFRGGLTLARNAQGAFVWDLTNLEIKLGTFQKKLGQSASLEVKKIEENDIRSVFIHDGLGFPLNIAKNRGSVTVQIPKTEIVSSKQRLPFQFLNEIPASGNWTIASRIEFRDSNLSEASLLRVDDALVNVAEIGSLLLRNGRGIGLLSVDLSSGDGYTNGNFRFDLQKAVFELNEGKYFKTESSPFEIKGTLVQNRGSFRMEMEDASVEAEIKSEGDFVATAKNFDINLLPSLGNALDFRGQLSGELRGQLARDALGEWKLSLDEIDADRAQLQFEKLQLPGLALGGAPKFEGRLSYSVSKMTKKLDGKLDLSNCAFRIGNLYEKPLENEMILRLRAQSEEGKWTSLSATGEYQENTFELKADRELFTIKVPRAFRWGEGLVSGSLSYALCEERLCTEHGPLAYDLNLSDFRSTEPLVDGLTVSGAISKTKDNKYTMKNFALSWPSGDRVIVDGNVEKFKSAQLQVAGTFDLKNVETSNPFIFFKELPTPEGNFKLTLSLKDGENLWTLNGDAQYAQRKLEIENLSLIQNAKANYRGRLDLDLEPYILRNDEVMLTSTLKNQGNLAVFEGLLMKGQYAAQLVVASSGFNLKDLLTKVKLRASGNATIDQLPVTMLIGEGLATYAKEKQRAAAKNLAKCYPKRFRGKFDLDYNQGRFNLSPSAFQGIDKDSMIKLQGVLGDLSTINLIANYLPGPKCEQALADCLGDSFPKGGMAFEVTGAFKDPETDFDFAFIDQSLEKCREQQANRSVAGESKVDKRDQRERIKELKDFYKTRKLDP